MEQVTMKKTYIALTPVSWKAIALSGCTALALSTVAVGQANPPGRDRPLNDRSTQSTTTNQDQRTFEGKIKPLFSVLSEDDPSSSTRQREDWSRPNSTTQPGRSQPGSQTQPGNPNQPGQPGSATQPGSPNQPGSVNTPGVNPQDRLGVGGTSSPLAGAISQPLALICDSESSDKSGTSSGAVTQEGNQPGAGGGAGGVSPNRSPERSAGVTSSGGSTEQGDVYVLVFDPADPQSRTAYQMAQAIASSQHPVRSTHGSPGSIRTTPSATGTPGSSETERAPREQDQQQPGVARQSRTGEPSTGMAMGNNVKITGRVIERDGIQAIAVQQVERQPDSASSIQRGG
jgi:hypothetical protein